jgi:hypothetical protein
MRRLWHGVRRSHLHFFATLPILWQLKRTNQPESLLTIMGIFDEIALAPEDMAIKAEGEFFLTVQSVGTSCC